MNLTGLEVKSEACHLHSTLSLKAVTRTAKVWGECDDADSLWDGLKASFPLLENLLVGLFWRPLCGRGRAKAKYGQARKVIFFFFEDCNSSCILRVTLREKALVGHTEALKWFCAIENNKKTHFPLVNFCQDTATQILWHKPIHMVRKKKKLGQEAAGGI